MTSQPGYGAAAKVFHWATVLLLIIQYLIGWLMPDIKRGMPPGTAMNVHLSFGLCILTLIVIRYAWRLGHPVAAEPGLPAWQSMSAEAVHRLLYVLVLVTTVTGWIFASMRGWTITVFGIIPVPALVAENSELGRAIGRQHGAITWVLLAVIVLHVLAALFHAFVHRDGVLQRMLPGGRQG